MTTETKAPTEADVDQQDRTLMELLRVGQLTASRMKEGRAALASIKALALLGVQVPGLREQIVTLEQTNLSWEVNVECMKEEHAAEVSALQARVAELERERDAARGVRRLAVRESDALRTERDALRAQVAAVRKLAEDARTGKALAWPQRFVEVMEAAALSTPPAEAKPEPSCPKCGHSEHWDAGASDRAPHSYCAARHSISAANCGCTYSGQ